jgi:hypothetical protein
MTRRDDRSPDMPSSAQFDAAIERVLRGDARYDDVMPLAGFVDDVRVMASGPPPPPSLELTAILAGSPAGSAASAHARWTRSRAGRPPATAVRVRVAALGVAGKAAVSLTLAGAVAAGGVTGILPDPANHFVRRAIEVVTPFELPDDATDHHGSRADPKADAAAPFAHQPTKAAPAPARPTPPGTTREAAVFATRSPDVELQSGSEGPPEVSPAVDASHPVHTHPNREPSPGQGPKPATPTSSPYTSDEPASAPPSHGGPATKPEPGPHRDDVPRGRPPAQTPPAGSSQSGGAPPQDRGPAEATPKTSSPNGPLSGPGSPGGPPPSGPNDPPPKPAQPPPCDPSPGGGPDRGSCGQLAPGTASGAA